MFDLSNFDAKCPTYLIPQGICVSSQEEDWNQESVKPSFFFIGKCEIHCTMEPLLYRNKEHYSTFTSLCVSFHPTCLLPQLVSVVNSCECADKPREEIVVILCIYLLTIFFLGALGGKEWERCIELVWDERSNSSLCLFYLLNEQSATRSSSLEFTQRPVCQLGNSTCNRADSCERLERMLSLEMDHPCVCVCVYLFALKPSTS